MSNQQRDAQPAAAGGQPVQMTPEQLQMYQAAQAQAAAQAQMMGGQAPDARQNVQMTVD